MDDPLLTASFSKSIVTHLAISLHTGTLFYDLIIILYFMLIIYPENIHSTLRQI